MDESTPLIGRRREGRRGARGALVVGALACACGTLVAFANCPHLVSQFSRAIGVGDADGAGARGVNAVFARLGAVWGRDDSDYVYTSLERDLLRPHDDDDEIEDVEWHLEVTFDTKAQNLDNQLQSEDLC